MKPIIYNIPSFDAHIGTTIKFTWLGNQPVSNTLIIRDNMTNEIVYNKTQWTMKLEHIIEPNTELFNGDLYNASIIVTDKDGFDSDQSNKIPFFCFTTPTFDINIEPYQVIQSQTYGVEILYSQPEGELLQWYRIKVYDSNDVIVYDSNIRYYLETVKITNLQDNNEYSIIAIGETLTGMPLSTDRIDFTVDFIKPEVYFMCEVENMYNTGGVYIKSNIISVEGSSDSDVDYVDYTVADLTNNVVHFHKGFSISGDFSLMLYGYQFNVGDCILQLVGKDEIISVYYRCDYYGTYYFELNAIYKNNKYMITTVNDYNSEMVALWITRENGLFRMEAML